MADKKSKQKQVLILDAGIEGAFAKGQLNHSFVQVAQEVLTAKGMKVNVTLIQNDYQIEEEVKKIVACDYLIVQTPGYWMGGPWQLKKYFDTVLGDKSISGGGDGRHRDNPDAKYGTGGLLKGKYYMLSSTWNAPAQAFTDPKQFFEGAGIDGLFMPMHKTFQFIGMSPLPSFMANDIYKNPSIKFDLNRFKEHIEKHFN